MSYNKINIGGHNVDGQQYVGGGIVDTHQGNFDASHPVTFTASADGLLFFNFAKDNSGWSFFVDINDVPVFWGFNNSGWTQTTVFYGVASMPVKKDDVIKLRTNYTTTNGAFYLAYISKFR